MNQKKIKKVSTKRKPAAVNPTGPKTLEAKIAHPWRLCPAGEHWVRAHPRLTPKGGSTTVTDIKDHLVNIDQPEAYDPNLNIAAGSRWLFHKKYLLERRRNSWKNIIA